MALSWPLLVSGFGAVRSVGRWAAAGPAHHLFGDPAGRLACAGARVAEADREDAGDLGQGRDAAQGQDRVRLCRVLVARGAAGDQTHRVGLGEDRDHVGAGEAHGVSVAVADFVGLVSAPRHFGRMHGRTNGVRGHVMCTT